MKVKADRYSKYSIELKAKETERAAIPFFQRLRHAAFGGNKQLQDLDVRIAELKKQMDEDFPMSLNEVKAAKEAVGGTFAYLIGINSQKQEFDRLGRIETNLRLKRNLRSAEKISEKDAIDQLGAAEKNLNLPLDQRELCTAYLTFYQSRHTPDDWEKVRQVIEKYPNDFYEMKNKYVKDINERFHIDEFHNIGQKAYKELKPVTSIFDNSKDIKAENPPQSDTSTVPKVVEKTQKQIQTHDQLNNHAKNQHLALVNRIKTARPKFSTQGELIKLTNFLPTIAAKRIGSDKVGKLDHEYNKALSSIKSTITLDKKNRKDVTTLEEIVRDIEAVKSTIDDTRKILPHERTWHEYGKSMGLN